jgi:hypothetical protein
MLRGFFARHLPFVCALLALVGCMEIGGQPDEGGGTTENVASVELGSHNAGAGGEGNSADECVADADCGSAVGCGVCAGDGHCLYADVSTACGDTTDDECKNPDHCDGAGACVDDDESDGTDCGDPSSTECDAPDVCDLGECVPNYETAGTHCGDATNDFCTNRDTCDGFGTCLPNHDNEGVVCDIDVGTCQKSDVCTNGACVEIFADTTTVCGNPDDEGDCSNPDRCDGAGNCSDMNEAEGFPCGDPSVSDCNAADTCDGDGSCQANLADSGDPCGDQTSTVCNGANTCNSSGVCQENFKNTSTDCGDDSTTSCTAPDRCDGAGNCDLHHQPDTTPCGGSDTLCSLVDTCLSGVCQPNHKSPGTPCGNNTQTDCDNPDTCDNSGTCLPNKVAEGEPCDDGIACTVNTECDGLGGCDHIPNPSVDDQQCPSDSVQTACAIWACNPPACSGNADCVDGCKPSFLNTNTVCRVDNGDCDLQETCSGNSPLCPDDLREAESHVCQSASCVNAIAQAEIACGLGGDGSCPVVADMPCIAYQCDDAGVACRTDCDDSTHCQTDFYCDDNTCKPRIDPGQSCTDESECSASNPYCVDGLCCDSPCEGQCESCNQAESAGTCTVIPAGDQPSGDREDCAADGTSCDGYCDGVERQSCVYPGSETTCQDAACDSQTNAATEAAVCDGEGACDVGPAVDCTPYICGATQCRGDCVADSDCDSAAYCRAGVCTPKIDDGGSCNRTAQCQSGFCVDDVCCDARCDGQCEACNQAGSEGQCSAVTGAPVGDRAACNGSGDCAGSCDGTLRGACSYPGLEVQCREASCDGAVAVLTAQCDGGGSCPAAQTVECEFDCEGTICAGDACTIDANCPQGEHCLAGTCVPTGGPGAQCSDAGDCASGFCTDGVCCESACLGQCEACDVSGSEGSCVPAPSGDAPHGSRAACTSDGSVCGGSCDGSQRDGCGYPVGDVCRPGSCEASDSGSVAVVEAACQGEGRCPVEQQQSCGEFACTGDGELCDGDCANGEACASAEYCSAGVCVPKLPDGQSCGDDDQCQSDVCVDGACCNTDCSGQCEACDMPGQVGTCVAVDGATHGGRAACSGGGPCGAQCDGSSRDGCSFPDEGTSCGPAYCASGSRSDGQSCDGAGTCTAGDVEACLSLACEGTECATGCTTDADCTGENRCNEGVCAPSALIDAVDEGSCGCRVPGGRSSGAWLLLAGLLGSALLARRRRRAA